jgi:hypothetical protein
VPAHRRDPHSERRRTRNNTAAHTRVSARRCAFRVKLGQRLPGEAHADTRFGQDAHFGHRLAFARAGWDRPGDGRCAATRATSCLVALMLRAAASPGFRDAIAARNVAFFVLVDRVVFARAIDGFNVWQLGLALLDALLSLVFEALVAIGDSSHGHGDAQIVPRLPKRALRALPAERGVKGASRNGAGGSTRRRRCVAFGVQFI